MNSSFVPLATKKNHSKLCIKITKFSKKKKKKSINKFNALTICHNNRNGIPCSLSFYRFHFDRKKAKKNNCVNINISAKKKKRSFREK